MSAKVFVCKGCGGPKTPGKPCPPCNRSKTKRWRRENPERYAALQKAWAEKTGYAERYRKENAPGLRASAREWYAANRDAVRAREKRSNKTPEELARLHERDKRYIDPIAAVAKVAAWRKKNPDKRLAQEHRRRAAKAAGGSYTASQWRDLVKRYGGRCLCCGATDAKLTHDHVIPLSKGGGGGIDNIQPLCMSCNLKKGTKSADYR